MLQIATGKLFERNVHRENSLHGILYTNLHLENMDGQACSSPIFGRLLPTSELGSSPKMIIYEFIERIEKSRYGNDIIISHGADSYVQDMSMLVSLVFNCTCSPDIDLVRRLIGNNRGTSTGKVPNSLVSRIFDRDVFSQPAESRKFADFVTHLLGLKRSTFLSVMRAVRTYVTALHRIADDLELAYTLLVAAGESLTQDFDGYTSDWQSIPEQKRVPMDEALIGVDIDVASRVRNAMISIEHVALGRRFQAFVARYVSPEYFEGNFAPGAFPPGRSELLELLGAAYQARSQYVHQLLRLPDAVTSAHSHAETVLPVSSRQRMLTLQGLARLIRHVIIEFVHSQPTVDKEIYDYRYELSGVMVARLGTSAWIANTDGDIRGAGRGKLEGFLEQLSDVLLGVPGAEITDISRVLTKFSEVAGQFRKAERLPYWVMSTIFNSIVGSKSTLVDKKLERLMSEDLKQASVETLLLYACFRSPLECSIEEHARIFQGYKKKRGSKTGMHLPRLFEAAIGLELAERYRLLGDLGIVKQTVLLVADDYPDNVKLREWVRVANFSEAIRWNEILLNEQMQSERKVKIREANGGLGRARQRLKLRRQHKCRAARKG